MIDKATIEISAIDCPCCRQKYVVHFGKDDCCVFCPNCKHVMCAND